MTRLKKQVKIGRRLKSTPQSGTTGMADIIDETIDESFPASDAPAWTAAKEHHKKSTLADTLKDKIMVEWRRKTKDFDYESYNRDAKLTFSGNKQIQISNPPKYYGDAKYANSEELFISAVSCCYMQTFLAVASKQGYNIKRYIDKAVGTLGKDSTGRMCITEINLNPKITFEGIQPSDVVLRNMQKKAHDNCFIANSACSKINIAIKLTIN